MTAPIITIGIVGAIGVGKTTLANNIIERIESGKHGRIGIVMVSEPIDVWIHIGIYQLFLEDQARWALSFQHETFTTRIIRWTHGHAQAQEMASSGKYDLIIVILERTPYCDKYFFAEELHECGKLTDTEFQLYNLWFDYSYQLRPANLDFYLWIDTPLEEAIRRIRERNRTGEDKYDPVYLRSLQERHAKHLQDGTFGGIPVVIIDGMRPFHQCQVTLDDVCSRLTQCAQQTVRDRMSLEKTESSVPITCSVP